MRTMSAKTACERTGLSRRQLLGLVKANVITARWVNARVFLPHEPSVEKFCRVGSGVAS